MIAEIRYSVAVMSIDKHFILCLVLQLVVGIVASDSKLNGRFRRSNKVVIRHAYYVACATCRAGLSRRSKYRLARRTTKKTHYNCNSKQVFIAVYVNICADARKNFCSYVK
jgi:hypothetical protein